MDTAFYTPERMRTERSIDEIVFCRTLERGHDRLHELSSLHNYHDLAVRCVVREFVEHLFRLARFISCRNDRTELYKT